MRKNDPLKTQYIVTLGILVFDLAYIAFIAFRPGAGLLRNFEIIAFFLVLLMTILAFVALIRSQKRTRERESRAMSGDASLLAQPQPVPDQQALPLPTTMSVEPNTKIITFSICLMVVIIVVVAFVTYIAASQSHSALDARSLLFFSLFILIAAAVIALISWLMFKLFWKRLSRRDIIVQEPGITTHYYGKATTVLWNDAQCFAMWGTKTKNAQAFELIGKDSVVRWIVPLNYRLYYPFQRADYYEEYNRKVQLLPQLITAKTGLPLYDLRDQKFTVW